MSSKREREYERRRLEKWQERQAQAKAATATASAPRPDRKSTAAATTNTVESESAGVSAAKLSQFYAIVDDARAMAKKVMRSSNSQNAQLARSYDANLKTLRASMGGVKSDKEADRLIKQANQTRAYVQFLAKQLEVQTKGAEMILDFVDELAGQFSEFSVLRRQVRWFGLLFRGHAESEKVKG